MVHCIPKNKTPNEVIPALEVFIEDLKKYSRTKEKNSIIECKKTFGRKRYKTDFRLHATQQRKRANDSSELSKESSSNILFIRNT